MSLCSRTICELADVLRGKTAARPAPILVTRNDRRSMFNRGMPTSPYRRLMLLIRTEKAVLSIPRSPEAKFMATTVSSSRLLQ